MLIFSIAKGFLQSIFECVQTLEGEIVEVLLAQLVPDVFDRIKLRGVGWQRQ